MSIRSKRLASVVHWIADATRRFYSKKISLRATRRILLPVFALGCAVLLLPSIVNLVSAMNTPRGLAIFDDVSSSAKGEGDVTVFIYLSHFDVESLTASGHFRIQIIFQPMGDGITSNLYESGIVSKQDRANLTLSITVREITSEQLGPSLSSDSHETFEFQWDDVMEGGVFAKSKMFDFRMRLFGQPRSYPNDKYYGKPYFNVWVTTDSPDPQRIWLDVGAIVLIQEHPLLASSLSARFISHEEHFFDTLANFDILYIVRDLSAVRHVNGTLMIAGIMVVLICVFLFWKRDEPYGAWEGITGTAAIMFSLLPLRAILIPDEIPALGFVDAVLGLYLAILIAAVVMRMVVEWLQVPKNTVAAPEGS